jgi:hypothetical protein
MDSIDELVKANQLVTFKERSGIVSTSPIARGTS